MELTKKQLEELAGVFRAEATEHVRGLAEAFLTLEEGTVKDTDELITTAFRHAHSLKGSAGTLGFSRVAEVTHRLEDVLGLMSRKVIEVTPQIIDELLTVLDLIRKAVEESMPGDNALTEEERHQIAALEELLGDEAAKPIPVDKPDQWTGEGGGGALADIPLDQLEQLAGVFRSEAAEHMDVLTETLLAFEDGSVDNEDEALGRAFRHAHSLKGSAGTLGFERVAVLTHRLEDVLGRIRQTGGTKNPIVIEALISTIDVMRKAVEQSAPGESELSPEEADHVLRLEQILRVSRTERERKTIPPDVPRSEAFSDLPLDQLAQLSAVFREEAMEHVKGLAMAFLSLENDRNVSSDFFDDSMRHAHSLKGSAGTLGFDRVAVLTHRLEEVLEKLREGIMAVDSLIVDVLLGCLDLIRQAVEASMPGEDELSDDEADMIGRLEILLAEAESSRRKPTEKKKETAKKGKISDIPPDQVEYLTSIFRSEAVEHIKGLAEALLTLDDSGADPSSGLLESAFRHAHSLKGSASTLGFERVALLTHRLEDALGVVRSNPDAVNADVTDMLLGGLDAIRRAVESSTPGDDELTEEEIEHVARLEAFVSETDEDEEEQDEERPSVVPSDTGGLGAFADIPPEQLEQLTAVFKSEAVEHVKGLAEAFLTLDDGVGDEEQRSQLLTSAFRHAHSLKGSAGTLGFERVATVTHRLEDVLGQFTRGGKELDSASTDLMLNALDVIREAVEKSAPGDVRFTAKEKNQIALLEKALSSESEIRVPAEKEPDQEEDDEEETVDSAFSELPPDQLAQLSNIFKAEAQEHIKALAEVLFAFEDSDKEVPADLITRAFRAAHSLKGSAGTLGFGRISTLTHRLEDVLGALRDTGTKANPAVTDLLLSALDAIRKGVETGTPGESKLRGDEKQLASALARLTADLKNQGGGASEPKPKSDSTPVAKKTKTSDRQHKPAEKKPPKPEAKKEPRAPAKQAEAFIRIAESKVDAVIAQVGELFEANLQIESLGSELDITSTVSNEITEMLTELQWQFQGTGYEEELYPIIEKCQSLNIHLKAAAKKFDLDEKNLSKLIQAAQEELRKIRLAPVSTIFVTIRRQVREVSKFTGKKVELYLGGGEYAVDRKVLEAIEDPLIHLLRNAVDHGIEDSEDRVQAGKTEVGRLSVVARHTGDSVELTVADDGKGIDPEKIRVSLREKRGLSAEQVANLSLDQLLDYLFESGFSTSKDVTKVSGRGVGLDVVKYTVERLGGEVRIESRLGEGTATTMRLPLAMSTVRCLLIKVSGRVMAIPASNIEKVLVPNVDNVKVVGGGQVVQFEGQNVPMGLLSELLGLTMGMAETSEEGRIIVMVRFGERRFAFVIDELVEYAQLILKPLGDLLERVPNISGISLLGTGELALVLNPADLVRAAGGVRKEATKPIFATPEGGTADVMQILVVDDSIATRTLEKTLLESAGFSVLTASDGYKALDVLATNKVSIVISDVQMPNMGGIELTRTIKSRPQFAHIPVILITSLGSDEDKAHGMSAGADAYIVKKELTQSELINTINQLL